ncbi:MAG TPA: hypothetical protein VNV41_01275 [Candidatus Acidoferrales bacterium]|nr:hypothetical protein [Candidatus Acidoferrales bacterium]
MTTPAGTFACAHDRAKDGRADVSTQVAPFSVVKTQGKNTSMVPTKLITGAHDKIVGTPVPPSSQMMMQQVNH